MFWFWELATNTQSRRCRLLLRLLFYVSYFSQLHVFCVYGLDFLLFVSLLLTLSIHMHTVLCYCCCCFSSPSFLLIFTLLVILFTSLLVVGVSLLIVISFSFFRQIFYSLSKMLFFACCFYSTFNVSIFFFIIFHHDLFYGKNVILFYGKMVGIHLQNMSVQCKIMWKKVTENNIYTNLLEFGTNVFCRADG